MILVVGIYIVHYNFKRHFVQLFSLNMMAIETIPPVAILVLITLIASTILLSVTFKGSLPRGVVWIDKRDEFLSGTRSKLRAFFKGRNLFFEAYINVRDISINIVINLMCE